MMEMETSKRKRTENFSKSEEKLLIESVKKFTNIIECKKTDAVSNKEKNAAWKKVANCFNSNSQNYRAAEQLKTKYLNLKKQCKKNFAEEKKIKMGTGGGPFSTPKTSTVDEDIREILGSQVTGRRSNFDNDLDENALENVLDQGIQSEGITLEINILVREIAPKSGILKELVDNTGYEELEEHEGSENTDFFVCDDNANSFHVVDTPISQRRSSQSVKTQNNYDTESQWKVLKKPVSKVLKPNLENNTTSHEKLLLRPLQSQKTEAEEKSKKPIVRYEVQSADTVYIADIIMRHETFRRKKINVISNEDH
ncbi:unnamed protein product [Ceutorhynchus assimilis]|uniref:Regulatory protein zeste n=1 Tax=Ceutorhynchus assimilis TaxID=467358 RepID=A0A9N9MSK3_9CUCU|nr:unnamed protein product [Ceutorhynchus assimilis]